MSVYIKGMEMPTKQTTLVIFPNGYVAAFDATDSFIGESRCVPVPEHGRLGDLDELLDRAFGCLDEETFLAFQFLVNGSVTIIPADRADKEGE